MDLQPLIEKAQDMVYQLEQCGNLIYTVLWFLGVLIAVGAIEIGLLCALVFRKRSL